VELMALFIVSSPAVNATKEYDEQMVPDPKALAVAGVRNGDYILGAVQDSDTSNLKPHEVFGPRAKKLEGVYDAKIPAAREQRKLTAIFSETIKSSSFSGWPSPPAAAQVFASKCANC
jgi:hypothetical protein